MARPSGRLAALLILLVAAATVGGALASQHVFGLVPCKLCLLQRWPYYLGIPLAAATMLPRSGGGASRAGLGLLAIVFLVSAGLGAYHAGVEWGWFLGPSDCGGGAGAPVPGVGDLLRSLDRIRVVSCTEAAWRLLGLSLAGWNALVSLALAALAGDAALRPR
jgi:disulfide bond formation protein DsbB